MGTVRFYSDSTHYELEIDTCLAHGILRKVGLPTLPSFTIMHDQLEALDKRLLVVMCDTVSHDITVESSSSRSEELRRQMKILNDTLASLRTIVYHCRTVGADLSWRDVA